MTECVVWIGCNRPEYSKPSLDSLFNAENRPQDVYAFIDYTDDIKNTEVINLVNQYPNIKIVHRTKNHGVEANVLLAFKELYPLNYDVIHYLEDDIIISKQFFNKSREALRNENVTMFCGCIVSDYQINKTYPYFSTWGASYKRRLFDLVYPHIEQYLLTLNLSHDLALKYISDNFNTALTTGFDALLNAICVKNNLLATYPERSYCKDIGAYGYHRLKGEIPIKTLEEWEAEPTTGVFGYGIQGINFKLD